ncbi:energy-coupled thiamine transporter ThiT [Clostridium gasigenes]|uniref:Thiamine transporter n=1 Tax=Clostridium gasigenes TaxID=94869 RepID=A0A1H0NJL3_9CLOT|nr:energy-coupled thiamine transporter ThiT [Clostridium gasigenes]MBB6623671.1 energy-coupled thiamine transporter ThiT [Clostridium gasigenes]MBB6716703.1 energy-coupled thiamine transporter ThiT [Clostridium gasigenes]MBU3087528.1 energy-coupled thiamine transporter ThiT [Clostridium gasigenes]MBU3106785.1 energy-coupled thiamine transporter ThiT [Clostridium gasigenes]SDO92863.1 thiamine transporter [Clostridium gasigenes]
MVNAIIILVSLILLSFYLIDIKNNRIDTKKIVMVGMTCAISYILYMIPFIKYPQGGGITLLSMMPVMILSILCGRQSGLTAGLIFGLLKVFDGAMILNPAQFLLDFIFATMALGLAGTFGNNKKYKVVYGCILAIVVSVSISVLSGVVYFGQFAPPGMNLLVYSLLYNVSSAGVEGLVVTIVIGILPLNRLNRAVNKKDLYY